jgi:hypothetical protein
VVLPPRAADLVDGKMNSLNEKKEKQICAPSKFCIIESNKRKFSEFDFFKFMISIPGNHFDISARAPPNVATPLTRRNTIYPTRTGLVSNPGLSGRDAT